MNVCNHRWDAPRGDAPTSVDVIHVCALASAHEEWHWCPCGAEAPRRVRDLPPL